MEALVVADRFGGLFTAREIEHCELRLEAFDVDVATVRRGAHIGRMDAAPSPRWGAAAQRLPAAALRQLGPVPEGRGIAAEQDTLAGSSEFSAPRNRRPTAQGRPRG